MHPAVDPGDEIIFERLAEALVLADGLNQIRRCAGHLETELVSSEVGLQRCNNGAAEAAVRGWILRVVRRNDKPDPVRIRLQFRIVASDANGGYWPPEGVGELRIPASDECIGRRSGEHREQSRGVESRKALAAGNVAPGVVPLLHRMNADAPDEPCKVGLFLRPDTAHLAAVILCFLVVPHPDIAVQIGRRGWAELRRTIHGPGRDVANPGRCRRQVPRRRSLPNAGSRLGWLPGCSGVPAVIGSQVQNAGRGLLAGGDAVELRPMVPSERLQKLVVYPIQLLLLIRVERHQHVVSGSRDGRLRESGTPYLGCDSVRSERIAADGVYRVIDGGMNDRGFYRTQ